MGAIVVLNNVKWKPAVSCKALTVGELTLDLSFPGDAVGKMEEGLRKIFDKKFKAAWEAKFAALKQAETKAVQNAVTWTEQRIAEKKTEAERQEVISTANKLLKQGLYSWQLELQKACDECVLKASKEACREMKLKEVGMVVKSVGKVIGGIIVLILTKGRTAESAIT